MKNIKKLFFIFCLAPLLAGADNLINENPCADIPRAAREAGFTCHAKWLYAFRSQGVEYTQEGPRPWNYRVTFTEQITKVEKQNSVTVLEALRTLKSQKGKAPAPDFMPRMGKVFYIFKAGEPVYARWNAYERVGAPSYTGLGVYQQFERLELSHLANSPILYVLPLPTRGAWHQSISEREENHSDHFLSGPRVVERDADGCYKIIEPSTTTTIESWIGKNAGLVRRIEEREGGIGHGSLVYRSETQLLRRQAQ